MKTDAKEQLPQRLSHLASQLEALLADRAGLVVVAAGHVRRRFFRAGGATQSRTEVVVERLSPASDSRAVERVRKMVVAALGP